MTPSPKSEKIKQLLLTLHTMSNIEARIVKLFNMTDAVWMRHANPWSVYTRILVSPLLTLSIWSRVWIGNTGAVLITLLLVIWTWYNPRIFPRVKDTRNWASRGVLGERVWINRHEIDIPDHHKFVPSMLNIIASFGVLIWIYGLWMLDLEITLIGLIISFGGKMWFVDRMVCLWEDMKEYREYSKWEVKGAK